MSNLGDAIAKKSTLPTSDKPNPAEILKKFLDDNNLELRLTPPNPRLMQDGGLLLDPPQIVVNYKQEVKK